MTITQQQAIEALESVHGAIFKAYGSPAYRVLRQYIEQGAAPGADVVMGGGMLVAGPGSLTVKVSADGTLSAVQHPQQEQPK